MTIEGDVQTQEVEGRHCSLLSSYAPKRQPTWNSLESMNEGSKPEQLHENLHVLHGARLSSK